MFVAPRCCFPILSSHTAPVTRSGNKALANKFMRYRVVTQGVTVFFMMWSLKVQEKERKWQRQEYERGNFA